MKVIDSALESEVLACFTAYEEALSEGDVAAMDSWFADDARTIRFGIGEEHGVPRSSGGGGAWLPGSPAGRRLVEHRGRSLGGQPGRGDDTVPVSRRMVLVGRQSQTWLLTEAGWRIIHAHVSERTCGR